MITPELLRDWNPCHRGAALNKLIDGRTSASPREISDDERITLEDRLWVLCHALWYRSESAARTFAIDSAALVSHLAGRPEDCAEHARLVADLRRIYALPVGTERDAELNQWAAANDAARAATWAATWAAAWAAARAAARAATWAATWAAAYDAANDAAWAAAWAAARAAELRKAIDRALIAMGTDADGWTP